MPTITLEARNYRGLRWAKWSPSGLCVLVGPNGSGKTTLLSLTEFWRVAYDRGLASAIDSQGGAWGLRHLLARDDEYFGLHVTVDNLYWALQPSVRGASVDPRPGERLLHGLPGQPVDRVLEREPFSNGYTTKYHPGFTVWDDERLALRALYDSGQAPGLKPFVSAIQAFRFYRSYNGWHLRRNGSPHSSDRVLTTRGENAFTVLRNWRDMRDLRPRYEYVLGGLRAAFPEAFADMDFEVAGQTISLRVYQPGFSEAVPLYYMPEGWLMCEEYRLFFWRKQLLIASHYHRQPENPVDWSPFVNVAQRFDAPFFSMDVALAETGNWIVVDMGAGECSSLPPSLDPTRFYSRLAEMMGAGPGANQIPPPTS